MSQDTVTGAFTATGRSATYSPRVSDRSTAPGQFNIFLKTASFIGSVQLERSNDGGTTWYTIGVWSAGSYVQLNKYTFTGSEANTSEITGEGQWNVVYSLNCTTYTSGTLTYALEGTR